MKLQRTSRFILIGIAFAANLHWVASLKWHNCVVLSWMFEAAFARNQSFPRSRPGNVPSLSDFEGSDGQSGFSCSCRWHFKVGATTCECPLTFRVMDATPEPRDFFISSARLSVLYFFLNVRTDIYFCFSVATRHKGIFLYIQQLPHGDIFILTAALKADLPVLEAQK